MCLQDINFMETSGVGTKECQFNDYNHWLKSPVSILFQIPQILRMFQFLWREFHLELESTNLWLSSHPEAILLFALKLPLRKMNLASSKHHTSISAIINCTKTQPARKFLVARLLNTYGGYNVTCKSMLRLR